MTQTEQEVAEIVESKVRRTTNMRVMQELRRLFEGVRQEEEVEARTVRGLSILFAAIVLTAALVIALKWLSTRTINVNPSTQAYAVTALSQVVHYVNTNYQTKIKSVKAEGKVTLELSIDATGRLKSVKVVRSSGNMALDNMAKDLVEMSGAFPPFPDEMKKDTDIIEITRTFSFVNNDLSAQ